MFRDIPVPTYSQSDIDRLVKVILIFGIIIITLLVIKLLISIIVKLPDIVINWRKIRSSRYQSFQNVELP